MFHCITDATIYDQRINVIKIFIEIVMAIIPVNNYIFIRVVS